MRCKRSQSWAAAQLVASNQERRKDTRAKERDQTHMRIGLRFRFDCKKDNAVPDISASEIPKPLDWQEFQRACVILFRCVLGDPTVLQFGSEGQTQHGIDLLGYRNADTSRPVGIQCRCQEKQLTEKKIRADIEEARAIEPALTEFIFATTPSTRGKSAMRP